MTSNKSLFIYCDCFSGISGDMFLGALLDLGASLESINSALKSLLKDSVEVVSRKERRGNLWGTRAIVNVKEKPSPHVHRNLKEIINLLEGSKLPEWVITKSADIFRLIAEAEGIIHNMPPEEIHFHEVGALDSIADIVGSTVGMFNLGVYELQSSPLPLGRGTIETLHGLLPLPAPATLEILKGVPVYGVEASRELVTPTGAAILKTFAKGFGSIPTCKIEKIGYGVGSHPQSHPPNMLRLIVASKISEDVTEELLVIEANIDDMPQEFYEHAMERLFASGALDVWMTPIVMKKSRPAITISVLCPPTLKEVMENILFLETTTAGIRSSKVSRRSLNRREDLLKTPWGVLKIKILEKPDGSKHIMPEYESCREISKLYGVPLPEIYRYCLVKTPISSTASEQKD
ncbi:MAG: nickel pincer cofactor biosynthesis protein LarC [Syntrophobacterales bacterium]|nr:nickel pincer cofactor biosynthesis protein LarC [Syntrophobacterales bacterium]